MKQDSEIAPRRRGGRRVNEFLNKKFSDLCELCASAVNTSSQKTRNSRENKGRITGWLPRLVGRVPATVHSKLLVAFLTIVVLLIAVGVVGLQLLSAVNRRAEEMVKLQRKIAAYRQLQHGTTAQLYSVTSALLLADERTLSGTLRQLNQFGYDLDRLQFVARDEAELLGQVQKNYDQFVDIVTKVVELIRAGKAARRTRASTRRGRSSGGPPGAPHKPTCQQSRS